MDIKFLLQALSRVWLMEESEAYRYAEVLLNVLNGNATITGGLFDDNDDPYRANSSGERVMNGEVLVLPIAGPMMKNDFCGMLGTSSMAKLVEAVNKDDSILSIVLSIDSPGGTVDGTEAFANTISASKKPVVAHASMMASAAYWAGSSAREIVLAGETAMAGSIGTMATIRDSRAFQEKNGIKELMITATRSIHKNKAALDAMDGKTEAYIKEILDPLNAVFEGAVTNNRQGKLDLKKEDVLTGKVYIGSNAINVGLADKIGTLDYAIKRSLQLAKTIK